MNHNANESSRFAGAFADPGAQGAQEGRSPDRPIWELENNGDVRKVSHCKLPTRWGEFELNCYVNACGKEHLAIFLGDLRASAEPVLCRVHSECLTGDAFGSLRCDCGPQLRAAMRRIQDEGRGVIVYLRQEGRGIGLIDKMRAYELQDGGMDTVEANLALGLPADARNFAPAAAILKDLGCGPVRLMTNNPAKIKALEKAGVAVAGRVPLQVGLSEQNRRYLETKIDRMGHLIDEGYLSGQAPADSAAKPGGECRCDGPHGFEPGQDGR